MRNLKATIYIAALLLTVQAFAGEKGSDKIQESMYSAMNNSNIGMEFYLTFHPAELSGTANSFKIYVGSDYETEVTLTMPWSGKIIKKLTKKRGLIEFSLSADEALCYTKKPEEKPLGKEVFNRKAIHLTSDAPVTVYAVAELNTRSGGYLALPVDVLGDEYIVASTVNGSVQGKYWLPGYSSIVIAYDSTDVDITPSVPTFNITAGETKKFQTLMAGDIVLIASQNPGDDLSGTIVKASKPVGVISGNYCSYNSDKSVCDYTIEMESPMYSWGRVYPVFPIQNNSGYLLKILSSENGKSKIFRNGEQIGQLPAKGGTDNIGYLIHESTNEPVVISSDKRINVVQYNLDKNLSVMPFQMNVIPFSQYSNEIYFSTPGLSDNSFYDKTYINVIYKGNQDGTLPDDMIIYIPEQGSLEWKPKKLSELSPGSGNKYQSAGSADGYYTKTIELSAGNYRMQSNNPFSVYSYGNAGNSSSYGFPAAVILKDTTNDQFAPVPKWTLNCDGSVSNGIVTDMPENQAERSNMQAIVLIADSSKNYRMTYSSFIPGMSRSVNWGLSIIDNTKDAIAVIRFIDKHGNDTTIKVNYYAPDLTITPPLIDFGTLKAGRIGTSEVTIKNNSLTSSFTITKAENKSDKSGFSIETGTVPAEIKPGKSIILKIRFSSSDEGDFADSLGFGDDCVFAYRAKLTAKTLKPVIKVSDIDFGEVILGNEIVKSFWVYNKGLVDLVVTDTTGNENKAFKPMFNREFSPNPGLTIKPGDSLRLDISFKPSGESYFEDRIVFSSDASGTDSSVILKGYGIIPGLKITALDFGKRRIDRPKFSNDGPYESKIRIVNESTKPIDILNIEKYIVSGNETVFITTIDEVKGKLNPGEFIERDVKFHPEITGEFKMKLVVTYTGGNKKETMIMGTGVLPRIVMKDGNQSGNVIDFGDIPVNRPAPVAREIKLVNEPWQYADELNISDIEVLNDINSVGTSNRQFGTEGFYFDKSSLGLPIKLMPGDTMAFVAEYISPKVSENSAQLKINSDAENELILELKGSGLESKITIESNKPKICLGQTDTIELVITNVGNLVSVIKSLEFTSIKPDLSFSEPFEPFALEPMAARTIKIIYNPVAAGIIQSDIIINSDFDGKEKTYTHNLEAESFRIFITSEVSPIEDNVLVGQDIQKSIIVSGSNNISDLEIKELKLEVKYDGSFLELKKENIKIGNILDGLFEIANIDINDNLGIATFRVTSSAENRYFSSSGEIVRLLFHSFYPSGNKDVESVISHSINVQSDCIEFNPPKDGSIKVGIICSENLKLINFTGGKYSLETAKPMPAGSIAIIKFSLALDAFTTLKVYNSMGKLVDIPLSQSLKNGIYEFELNLENYNSGVYWYVLGSGPYTATNKMVISK